MIQMMKIEIWLNINICWFLDLNIDWDFQRKYVTKAVLSAVVNKLSTLVLKVSYITKTVSLTPNLSPSIKGMERYFTTTLTVASSFALI